MTWLHVLHLAHLVIGLQQPWKASMSLGLSISHKFVRAHNISMQPGTLPAAQALHRTLTCLQGWPRDGQSDQDWATDQEQPSTPAHDYGSQAANKAVQRLQSLGATVHPPVAKDAMDWGVLAGKQHPCHSARWSLDARWMAASCPGS